MKKSEFLRLGWRDLIKGLLMAILVPVIGVIQQSLEQGNLFFDWKNIGLLALSGGFGYLVKNFFEGVKNEN